MGGFMQKNSKKLTVSIFNFSLKLFLHSELPRYTVYRTDIVTVPVNFQFFDNRQFLLVLQPVILEPKSFEFKF